VNRVEGLGSWDPRQPPIAASQQRANRIGDLVVATVRNGNRQRQAVVVGCGRFFRGTDCRNGRGGQHFESTGNFHANPLLMNTGILGERRHLRLDGGKDT